MCVCVCGFEISVLEAYGVLYSATVYTQCDYKMNNLEVAYYATVPRERVSAKWGFSAVFPTQSRENSLLM